MIGEVAILNVAAGDTKLTFDPSKPDEVKRSAGIVRDMIRRGFVLLIEVGADEKGPIYRRALDFDESASEYIIAGDATAIPKEPRSSVKPAVPPRPRQQATPKGRARVPASATKAVAISRTAGG